MIPFLIYLLKVSASLLGLFIIYYFVLRHHTFHQANRLCLLLVILFSLIVPLVSVSVPDKVVPIVFETNDHKSNSLKGPVAESENQPSTEAPGFTSIATTVYLLGIIFFSSRFLKSIIVLRKLGRGIGVEIQDGFRIKRTDLKTSFTFLNTIFLPKTEKDTIILQHEQAHVMQYHWIDLLVAEFATIMLWFNPVLLLLKRELRLQHEFLADRHVMANGVSFEAYAHCLLKKMSSDGITCNVTSPLFSSSNKKRILMMTKKRTSSFILVAYLLMVPACAIMLMSFGRKKNVAEPKLAPAENIPGQNIPDIAPVDLANVTKVVLYGDVMDPRTNKMKNHTGIDFVLNAGSDVVATADGVVVVQSYGDKPGNYVRIKHNETYSTRYYHLEIALVKRGESVKKGQVIGRVGNTGLSTAAHLHYEIFKNDSLVDPKDYLPRLPGS